MFSYLTQSFPIAELRLLILTGERSVNGKEKEGKRDKHA